MSEEDVAVQPETADEVTSSEPSDEMSDQERAMAELKEAITVEKEEIGSLQLKLTVTIPEEMLDKRRADQFAELKRDADVPGFRRGHAPLRLVEKRFATDVGEQLKQQLLSSGYLAAIEKEELKTLGDPLYRMTVEEERFTQDGTPKRVESEKLLSIEEAIDNLKMPKEGPLTFSCEVELKPEFDLPELKGIKVKKPDVAIEDADVQREVERMLSWRGSFKPVEDGAIEADDFLYVDYRMMVDGEVVASQENFDMAARDVRLEGVPLTGFSNAIVGKKLNDQVTFSADIPDDHDSIDRRGKSATFEITVREIKRIELPELNEEFLAALGFDSEEELRKMIRESLEARLDTTINEALHDQIGEYLITNTAIDIPEGLSQRQADRAIARRMIEMYQAGVPQAEAEKRVDEMRASARDQAINDLKLYFILEKIAEDQEIEVGEEELNSAIAQMAQRANKRFDRMRDELSKGEGLFVLYNKLRDRKVLDDLLKDAEITKVEPKPKPAEKKKASKNSAKKSTSQKTSTKATAKKKTTKKTTKKSKSKGS